MKLKWSNYELSDSYDEYVSAKKSVRKHIKKIGNFFESLSAKEMAELDAATKAAIKSLGINFRIFQKANQRKGHGLWISYQES